MYNFWTPELWRDEYGTWWVVANGGWREVAQRAVQFHGQSPFYYFIVKLSSELLGIGPLSLRLPSILFGIGVVALAYPLAIEIFHQRHAALLTVAAFAVNERLIWYSQDARPYSLALFCTMLSFLFYLSLLKREKVAWRVGYILSTTGAYYAHYLFSFIVVIQIVHLFFIQGRSWLQSKAWPLTFLGLVLLCLPGVPQLLSLFERRETINWVTPSDWRVPIKLVAQLLDVRVLSVIAVVTLALRFCAKKQGGLFDRVRLNLVLLWFVLPIAFFGVIAPLLGVTLLHERYVLFVVPAALVLTAWLMALGTRNSWRQWIPLIVFLTISFAWNLIPPLHQSGTFSARYNEGWTRAVAFLESHVLEDDVILYRTGFVEADQLRLPSPEPRMVSTIQMPVTANLSSGHNYSLFGLPYRINEQTAPYLASVTRQAAKSRRVWIIGVVDSSEDSSLQKVAAALGRQAPFHLVTKASYGSVRVILAEQGSAIIPGLAVP